MSPLSATAPFFSMAEIRTPVRQPLRPSNRVILESTGLCKLQLSPKRENRTRPLPALPKVTSKRLILNVHPPQPEPARSPSRNEILAKYAQKQAKLMELENQAELVRYEIVELQAQLQATEKPENQAFTEVRNLTKKVSTMFQAPQPAIRKKASNIFASEPAALKQKASFILNNRFLNDVKEKMDQQQAELEEFTKKGSNFARSFLGFKKEEKDVADSSFMFENLHSEPVDTNKSILLSEELDSSLVVDAYVSDDEDYDLDESVLQSR